MGPSTKLDWNFVIERLPLLFHGALIDIYMSVIGTIGACLLGLVVVEMRESHWKLLSRTAYAYTQIVRGVPFYVLLLWIYFGLVTSIGLTLSAITSTIVALAITDSGKAAEIFRGGFAAIDHGQQEAAEAIGLGRLQAYLFVMLPQMIRVVTPPLGNLYITQLKGATYAAAIAVPEMVAQATELSVSYFRPFEAFAAVAIILVGLVMLFSLFFLGLERAIRLP